MNEQLELPLFDPPSFEEILSRHGEQRLRVTLSARLKRGWRVSANPLTGGRHLLAPSYLADAPADVKQALVEWALLPMRARGRRRAEVRERKRQLESVVWRHVEQTRPEAVAGRRLDPSAYNGRTKGCRYDLAEVRDTVNRTLLGGKVESQVRWGEYASLTSHQAMRTAPDGSRYSLVTIAGVYDHPDVPRFAVEAVMHHELLHVLLPPRQGRARRLVHGRDFRAAERAFPSHRQWREWERDNLRRLAASLRRRRRKPGWGNWDTGLGGRRGSGF